MRAERIRRCKRCGKEFPAPSETERTLCDGCRKIAKQESVIRDRTCTVCGAVFPGGPRAKYCPSCKIEKRRETNRRHKKTGTARKLGSIQRCERCGAEYILDAGTQRYCKSCSAEAIRENRRPKKREYQKDYDPDHAKRRGLKEGVRLCAICGEPIPRARAEAGCVITCSDACDKIRRSRSQAEADVKRGRRKTTDIPRRAPDLPESGVVGVTARRTGKPWQAQYRKHYIGVYDTVEAAAAAIEDYKSRAPE